jgi:hypothetical protein
MSDEESVKKLAETKAYLEKRAAELQDEVSKIKSIIEIVDANLAEKSFRKVELPKATATPGTGQAISSHEGMPRQTVPLKTPEGAHLADISQTETELTITPITGMKFDVSSPPFRAFLIGRVLEPMRNRDNAATRTGELSPDRVLSYVIEQDGNMMKSLTIKNYGDERRVHELRNAIRWTLRRMHERATANPGGQA